MTVLFTSGSSWCPQFACSFWIIGLPQISIYVPFLSVRRCLLDFGSSSPICLLLLALNCLYRDHILYLLLVCCVRRLNSDARIYGWFKFYPFHSLHTHQLFQLDQNFRSDDKGRTLVFSTRYLKCLCLPFSFGHVGGLSLWQYYATPDLK